MEMDPALAARKAAMHDPRFPPRQACVLRDVLDHHAGQTPEATFVRLPDGEEVTWSRMRAMTRTTAGALRRLGVKQGEHVLVWLPNGLDMLRVWFAINYIGAVYVPLNVAYRGALLAHTVALSDARLIVLDAELAPRLAEIDRAQLAQAVVFGDNMPAVLGIEAVPSSILDEDTSDPLDLERPIEPWDTQSIIFTSGTTGPSKAVLSSYMHLTSLAGPQSWQWLRDDDRFLINLPLFHIGGTSCVYAMMLRGASIALVERFETGTFWQVVRRSGVTAVGLMGAMTPFLMNAPPADSDRGHGLRIAVIIPLSGDAEAFARRFGVEVYTVFNMTEISTPLISERNPVLPGTSGKPRPGVEVRLVDENDCETPAGSVGELIIRTDTPWAMNHGYYKNPEATAAAWRNGWFHTGDSFRRDANNNFFFVDRQKDAIRRRGENISSFEVETEAMQHPAVREAAAIPVPSAFGEDEVMLVISLAPGVAIDCGDLVRFMAARMAHFMTPRYIRIVDDLPKTPTAKVQKHLLRQDGITPDTFDREVAGIDIRRR